MKPMRGIPERSNVDRRIFEAEILPGREPVVFRGLVSSWPLVASARESAEAAVLHLKSLDSGKPITTLLGLPHIKGEFSYGDGTASYNFQSGQVPLPMVLDRLLEQGALFEPHAVYVQSALVRDHLPGLVESHPMALLPDTIEPRIWIGNSTRVKAHHDMSENIACVVAGTRRFMLFPPEQLPNLYIGPLDRNPSGSPISMASVDEPNFEKFPKLRAALDSVMRAELGPGDALYIPYGWWHHVHALSPFNVLVNYWWSDDGKEGVPPVLAMMASVLAFRDMPGHQLRVWKCLFDHYIFRENGDPLAHLNEDDRGAMGEPASKLRARLKKLMEQCL